MNVIGMGGCTVGTYAQRDVSEAFLRAGLSKAPRHVRRFAKVVSLKPEITRSKS